LLWDHRGAVQGPRADGCELLWRKFESTAKEFNFFNRSSAHDSALSAAALPTSPAAPSMQFWLDLQQNAVDPLHGAAEGLVRRCS
jgi:hypothetical protein